MKHLFFFALFLGATLFSVTDNVHATIFFEFDAENGYQWLDSSHPGGGKFTYLGGSIIAPEGTGCSEPSDYHNTILSNEIVARGASANSLYSLKTPYNGACPDESFTRDTTMISLNENKSEVYVKWDQKFTGDWNSASVQHKFTKFTPVGSGFAMNDRYATGYFKFSRGKNPSQARIINVEGQFSTDRPRYPVCIIYQTQAGAGGQYDNVNRYWDNYNNKLGPNESDMEFEFSTDIWYSVEIHVKLNSSAYESDAILEMWVDGNKIFGLTNFRFFGPNDEAIPGVGTFEFQHIYYNRSSNNQPTYMDNIVIADEYIGPTEESNSQPPPESPIDFKKN